MARRTTPFMTFAVHPASPGHLDALARVEPPGANPIVRLLDSSGDTEHAVSIPEGGTARLSHDVAPRAYLGQLFVDVEGVRQVTLTVNITYP